jgi:lysophospholipase L1-like esterase
VNDRIAAEAPDTEPTETGRELLRLAMVVAIVALGAAVPYLIPSWIGGRFVGAVETAVGRGSGEDGVAPSVERLWVYAPGDPLPVVRLFSETHDEAPIYAGAGTYQAPTAVTARIREELGDAVAENLGSEAGIEREERPQTPGVLVDPTEYEGIEVEIEHPESLAPFFSALERTARREAGAITRISHYGDSSIATDLITHTMRRRLQSRFGDGGHGFVLIARGTMPYAHRDVSHRGDGWELEQLVMNEDRDGIYGFGGVAFRPSGIAYARVATDDRGPVGGRVSRFSIYYRRFPTGGSFRVQADSGDEREVDTRGPEGDAVEVVEVPDGPHSLEVRAGGNVRLFGIALERDGPAVVYDSIGLVGARARRLLFYDDAHIAEQMRLRDPDLLVLGFGGNEADDPPGRLPSYEPEFRQVIRQMRAGRRDLACVVFAPLDQARRDERGAVTTIETVPRIIEAQRNAANAEGCAFFDTFEAMGGEGSMLAWSRARPRLALTDYRHATPAGYEVIANMFYKALLKAFADHLDGAARSAPAR